LRYPTPAWYSTSKLKKSVYAAAGVSEYWIVDLKEDCMWVHRKPEGEDYVERTVHTRSETISPLCLPEAHIAIADFIPEV
jgi:Uma2 family endonuclease